MKPVGESKPEAQDEPTGFRTGTLNEFEPKAKNEFSVVGEMAARTLRR